MKTVLDFGVPLFGAYLLIACIGASANGDAPHAVVNGFCSVWMFHLWGRL